MTAERPVPSNPWDTVEVWAIPLAAPPEVVTALAGLLDPGERERSARFDSPGVRRRFVVSHGVTRLVLGRRLSLPPERLRRATGPYGKPEAIDHRHQVSFNLSHSSELGLLAVSGGRQIGVDVEHRRLGFPAVSFAARYFSEAEAAHVASAGSEARSVAGRFLRLWTRKEAVVKAAGGRLAQGLRIPVTGDDPLVVRDPRGMMTGCWLLRDLRVPAGYIASVAAAGDVPYRVVSRQWSHRNI